MVDVATITGYLNEIFPESTAEPWDAVGLTVGQDQADVTRVLCAVDIDPIVVAEAVQKGVQMLITHHPLFLSGTTTIAARTPKGRMVHDLITHGIALYTAHTNADIAPGGVNDGLAACLGLTDTTPLQPSTHPDALPGSGIGRVGVLPEAVTLEEFAQRVAGALPPTQHGVRVHGEGDRLIRKVAVCGGSGDSYLDAAHDAGVDAYLTADLRHHRASEAGHRSEAPALVDVAHFASEWTWLPDFARRLADKFGIETSVSTLNTDPWTARLSSTDEGGTR